MLLSLIIPFFNSEHKSKRLLKTLLSIVDDDVEIILVDDGSTDNTHKILNDFKEESNSKSIELITQDNKGPGGARNAGLRIAKGQYVWFVDSDDDIKIEAIEVVRQNRDNNYDFIDFNIEVDSNVINTMGIEEEEYIVDDKYRLQLLEKFGSIWSKVLKKKLLIDNNIFYPEYTLYEDNPLLSIYPFFIKKFLKLNFVGYIHHLDFDSVTRTEVNLRSFDRLQTALYGIEKGLMLSKNEAEIQLLERIFINKYLIITTEKLLTKRPSKNWIITWRVMKQYRLIAKELDIKTSPFEAFKYTSYNQKVLSYFTFQWFASFSVVADQTEYFKNIHKKAWK